MPDMSCINLLLRDITNLFDPIHRSVQRQVHTDTAA